MNPEIYQKHSYLNRDYIRLLILAALFLAPLLLVLPLLSHHKFLLFALAPSLGFLYLFLFKKECTVPISRINILWFIFLLVGVLSFFWAQNGSLIWSFAFGFSTLFTWTILFSIIPSDYHSLIQKWIVFIFFINAIYIVYFILFDNITDTTPYLWNLNFGYNRNYISTYLLSFLPFIAFLELNHRNSSRYLQCAAFGLAALIFFKSVTRGSIIILCALVLYYLIVISRKRGIAQFMIGLFFVTLVLFGLYLYVPHSFKNIYLLNEIGDEGDLSRIFMIKSSLRLLYENPLFGVGLGNWHTLAYGQDLTIIKGLGIEDFIRPGNHNFYSQILSEMGVLGFLALYLPICYPFLIAFKKRQKLTFFQHALICCFVLYSLMSLFYRDVNSYESNFSSISLLAFISIGMLQRNIYTKKIELKRQHLAFLFFLSLPSLGWHIYGYKCHQVIKKAHEEIVIEDSDVVELSSIFNTIFKTTDGFYGGYIGYNKSLSLLIAQSYDKLGRSVKAKYFYDQALKYAPFDENILFSYARFLLRSGELEAAKEQLLNIQERQDNYPKVNLLLAEISFEQNEYSKVRRYLNTPNITLKGRGPKVDLLNYQLYTSPYLFNLIEIESSLQDSIYIFAENTLEELTRLKMRISSPERIQSSTIDSINNLKYRHENILIRGLTEDQALLYFRDISENSNDYEIDRKLKLLEIENDEVRNILLVFLAKIEYYKKLYRLPRIGNIGGVNETSADIDGAKEELDGALYRVLSKKQFELFKRDDLNKRFNNRFIQLRSLGNLRAHSKNSLRELFVQYEYWRCYQYLSKYQGIGKGDSDRLSYSRFMKDVRAILSHEQWIEFSNEFGYI